MKKYLQQNADLMRSFRKNLDWKYVSYQELVLNCGLAMNGKPLPLEVPQGRPKSCYYNCQKLASHNFELIYVEGYALALDLSFPLSHAWLMNSHGDVVEPTWETPREAYFVEPTPRSKETRIQAESWR